MDSQLVRLFPRMTDKAAQPSRTLLRRLLLVLALVWLLFALLAAFSAFYLAPRLQQQQIQQQAIAATQLLATLGSYEQSSFKTAAQYLLTSEQIASVEFVAQQARWHFAREPAQVAPRNEAGSWNNPLLEFEYHPVSDTTTGSTAPLDALILRAKKSYRVDPLILLCGFIFTALLSAVLLIAVHRKVHNESRLLAQQLDDTLSEKATCDKAQRPALHFLGELQAKLMQHQKHSSATRQTPAPSSFSAENIDKKELELARQSAIKANRMKSRIIANTSHELLTPLNIISGLSELLDKPETTATQLQETARLIHDNAQHLTALVNDLIFVSEHGVNAINIEYQSTNIYRLLQSIMRSFGKEIEHKNLALFVHTDNIKNLCMNADAVRMRQIISNLIVNAIRNTEQGHIELSARLEQSADECQFLTVSVADTGCGIDDEQQQRIFEAFVSHDHYPDREQQPGLGFGLGLTIVRNLAMRLGASIDLNTEKNVGTRFDIKFPAKDILWDSDADDASAAVQSHEKHATKQTGDSKNGARAKQQSQGLNTLIVDDNQGNLYLLQQQLQQLQHHVDTASDGNSALALLQDNRYDWLFVDIRMQPIDGFKLLATLRKNPDYRDTPVIACTAHTSQEEYRRIIDAGFNYIIHKPVILEQIRALYARLPYAQAEAKKQQALQQDFYDLKTSIDIAGSVQVAKNIFTLLIQELKKSLSLRKTKTFTSQQELLDHFHHLNGAASMASVPTLKNMLNDFETSIKNATSATQPDLARQQTDIDEYISQFLRWAEEQDIERLFNHQG